MKLIRFLQDLRDVQCGSSYVKYAAGQCYPVTDETQRAVVLEQAEEVDAPEDLAAAQAAAARAVRKADQADEAAQAAVDAAAAAAAAQAIATQAASAADTPAA